jgi:hypothetical protein
VRPLYVFPCQGQVTLQYGEGTVTHQQPQRVQVHTVT